MAYEEERMSAYEQKAYDMFFGRVKEITDAIDSGEVARANQDTITTYDDVWRWVCAEMPDARHVVFRNAEFFAEYLRDFRERERFSDDGVGYTDSEN